MSGYEIFIFIGIFVFLRYKFRDYHIDFSSLFKKKLPKLDDSFGVIFVTGKQGTFKTYKAIDILLKQDKNKLNKVYTNITSLDIPDYDITYVSKIEELYFNTEKNCIFVLDEIARKYKKNSPCDTQFYAWLNQSRKMGRIVIMITQEWKELPMWIRRPVRYNVTTIKNNVLSLFGLRMCVVGDAENMVLDEDMEWVCPPLYYTIFKPNMSIANLYDTFEPINTL